MNATMNTQATGTSIMTGNMEQIDGVIVFGRTNGKNVLLTLGGANVGLGNFFAPMLTTEQPAPKLEAATAPVSKPATKTKPVEVEPIKMESDDTRESLMQKIKDAGGSCHGLGKAKNETLKAKLATLLKDKPAAAAAATTPAPTATTTTTTTTPARKGGGKPKGAPMKQELVKVAGLVEKTYLTKKNKTMKVLVVETKGDKSKVFAPAKEQPEGLAKGFMMGSMWWADNSRLS